MIKTVSGFLHRNIQARREWNDIFKIIEGQKLSSKNSMLAKLSFRNGKKKDFAEQTKAKGVHHH